MELTYGPESGIPTTIWEAFRKEGLKDILT